ncbi:MAG: AAA family ATPase [Acidobacteriota bacterium]
MKVINLFGGPGAGKSTTAAGLFHLMKLEHLKVELVTEYAKEVTWERRHDLLSDQLYIFAKQHRRLVRLRGEVDYVVTDAPLLLSAVYREDSYPLVFEQLVLEFWNAFDNCSFALERVKPYEKLGRRQTEQEAKQVDTRVEKVLARFNVPHTVLPADKDAAAKILAAIKELEAPAKGGP